MAGQKIRIKLAAYDHELVDLAASRIVETMKKSGAKISGPIPLPTETEIVTILRCPHNYTPTRAPSEPPPPTPPCPPFPPPPQQGTSMRTTVTLWMSFCRRISVSFSA